jgi:hypothetical protein
MADEHWMQKARDAMKRKGTVGKFARKAQAAGKSTQEYAREEYHAPGQARRRGEVRGESWEVAATTVAMDRAGRYGRPPCTREANSTHCQFS